MKNLAQLGSWVEKARVLVIMRIRTEISTAPQTWSLLVEEAREEPELENKLIQVIEELFVPIAEWQNIRAYYGPGSERFHPLRNFNDAQRALETLSDPLKSSLSTLIQKVEEISPSHRQLLL